MNQLITPIQAWWFTGVAALAAVVWTVWAVAVLQHPIHPWCSIPMAFAVFVAMYAWSATDAVTLRRLHKAISFWNLSVLVAIVLAAIFSPVGQPFPDFALSIILKAGAVLVLTVSICGLYNLYHHFVRHELHPA